MISKFFLQSRLHAKEYRRPVFLLQAFNEVEVTQSPRSGRAVTTSKPEREEKSRADLPHALGSQGSDECPDLPLRNGLNVIEVDAHSRGRPSPGVSSTSDGTSRMVEVTGAIVTSPR